VSGSTLSGLALAAVLVAPGIVAAADLPRARLDVAPREARVGDVLQATFEIWTSPDSRVERPELAPGGSLTFRETSWEGPVMEGGEARWVWKGSVAAFETGEIEVPAAAARVVGPDGAETVVRSEALSIRILSILPEGEAAQDLAGIKGPASIAPDYGAVTRALAVLAALLLVALGVWWLQRRLARRLAAVEAPEDPFHRMPPHEWVYRELQLLLERRLAEQGEVDRFFDELSHILKRYLGGRYRVDLMERTTAEVPPELRQAGAPREALGPAREVLERSDRVKFAGERPAPAECRAAVEVVYRIVDATRPAEQRGAA
jgi:hypothetical protein